MPEKLLIINADDFGLDSFCEEAICILASEQLITSTSILANLCSPHALDVLRKTKISTGLHINLIEGPSVSAPETIPTLLDEKGYFKTAFRLWIDFIFGKIRKEEIEIEMNAQYKKLVSLGIVVSHADSHQHIHQYPYLGNYILSVLQKMGVEKIRNCKVSEAVHPRMAVVRLFHEFVKKDNKKFTHPQALISTFSVHEKPTIESFEKSLSRVFKTSNRAEFMTHPALKNNPASYLNRVGEFNFWRSADWKNILNEKKIRLISYSDL